MRRDYLKARRRFIYLVVCMAMALAASLPADLGRVAAENTHATREGRLAVFDDVWSTINQRYYDRNFQGLDWQAQRATYRDLAANADSSQELYSLLRRMIASLDDSHTRIFAPEERFDWWRPRFVTIGASVTEIDGVPVVVNVEPGSVAHRAGIRPGDLIESVNGSPALDIIERRLGNPIAASTGVSRMRAFSSIFDGAASSSVEVGWRTRDGKLKKARFQRYWQQRELGVRMHMKDRVAIVNMDVFTRRVAEVLTTALRKDLREARALILDFRTNGGGDAEAMIDVASAFLASGLNMGQFTDRFGYSYSITTRTKSPFIPQVIQQTQVPVIILAGARTSSAAEIFIAAFKSAGRARVIGNQTCGCVLAIRHRHTLPDGGILDVSEMDYQTANWNRLEKRGVQPDIAVPVDRADLYAKRDRAMELAMAELKRNSLSN